MEINLVRERKGELESKIFRLLSEFEKESGSKVTAVAVSRSMFSVEGDIAILHKDLLKGVEITVEL